jgi:hypothetical protein
MKNSSRLSRIPPALRRCFSFRRLSLPARSFSRILFPLLGWAAVVLLAGCRYEDGDHHHYYYRDDPPAAPQGFWSMTGDERVTLHWYANTEEDLAGYRIYRGTAPHGFYPRIATVGPDAVDFVDRGLEDGVTYYYAIAAFDEGGNESELSAESVYDTPRPEGRDLRLHNADIDPATSGYDFSADRVLDYDDIDADIYYWNTDDDGPWMIATERSQNSYTDIQDAGYVSLDEIDRAPSEGWSSTGEVPLILGHSYVVWTWDNHYAKFRVVSLSSGSVQIDWAYQLDRGNHELSLPGTGAVLPAHRIGGGLRAHTKGMSGEGLRTQAKVM